MTAEFLFPIFSRRRAIVVSMLRVSTSRGSIFQTLARISSRVMILPALAARWRARSNSLVVSTTRSSPRTRARAAKSRCPSGSMTRLTALGLSGDRLSTASILASTSSRLKGFTT